jgi:hypothetical protein
MLVLITYQSNYMSFFIFDRIHMRSTLHLFEMIQTLRAKV